MIEQLIERVVDAGVQLVESAAAVVGEKRVVGDGPDSGCTEGGIHAVVQLQEQHADAEALRG